MPKKAEIEVPALEPDPPRPLTKREVASIMGGLLGGMIENGTPVEVVREAVNWWAGNPETWELFRQIYEDPGRRRW